MMTSSDQKKEKSDTGSQKIPLIALHLPSGPDLNQEDMKWYFWIDEKIAKV